MERKVKKRAASQSPALRLEGELTIFRVAELKAPILSALATPEPIEFDLSGITEMDGAGLQLLILAKREAAQVGKTVRFTGHSHVVLEVLEMTNLLGQFGDPVVLAAS